jgi:hypothetical protein
MWHCNAEPAVHTAVSPHGSRTVEAPHVLQADAPTCVHRHATLNRVICQLTPVQVLITYFIVEHQPVTVFSNVIATMLHFVEG